MRIGMDMDGCLVDFVGSALPRIRQLWGVDVMYEDIIVPRIEAAINDLLITPVPDKALCAALFQPGFFLSMLPRYGAIEAVKTLAERGHEIVILTRADLHAGHIAQEKAEWLSMYLGAINYKTIVVGSGCTKDLINVDVIVDDEPGNLEHPTAVSICVEHPWNTEYLANQEDRKCPVHAIQSMGFLPMMIACIERLEDSTEELDQDVLEKG